MLCLITFIILVLRLLCLLCLIIFDNHDKRENSIKIILKNKIK